MKWLATAVAALGVLIWGSVARAQTYTVSGPVPQAYVPLANGTPVDLMVAGSPDADDGAATIPLGFSFPYYGQSFTSVTVNANGYLLFGGTVCTDQTSTGTQCYQSRVIPGTTGAFHNVIAPWWGDLSEDGSPQGVLRYSKPNPSQMAIEWSNFHYTGAGLQGTLSFEVVLDASGLITVSYGSHAGVGSGSVSTGFEDSTGAQGAPFLACGALCAGANWPDSAVFRTGRPTEAELVVDSVELSNLVVGANDWNLTVKPTFHNLGGKPANNYLWRVYLSTDTVKDANDRVLYTSTTPLSTDVDQATSATAAIVVNSPKPPAGNYYILVEVDATNIVLEASESNNVGSTASPFIGDTSVDLVAVGVFGPSNTGPESDIQVNVRYFNRGGGTPGNVGYRIYLSDNETLDSNDFVLYEGTRTLTGAETVNENVAVHVPTAVPGGKFYYILELDPAKAVTEVDETNNLVVSTAQVSVEQADLVIDSLDFVDPVTGTPIRTGYFGQPARVVVKLHNAGGADAHNFFIGMAVSDDDKLSLLSDVLAHEEPVAVIASGQNLAVTFDFTLPTQDKQGKDYVPGDYTLFALLDSRSQISETNETNNSLPLGVTLRVPAPDYTVTTMGTPTTAAVGEVAPVFRVIKNIGNVAGTAVTYRYYASANDMITTDDVPLNIVSSTGMETESGTVTLGIGEESSATERVRLPRNMPAGTYYIGAFVDVDHTCAEIDESNNAVSSTTTTEVVPPGLRITTPQLPDGIVGRSYNFHLVSAGAEGAVTWSLDPDGGALPGGLTLAADGSVTGSPTTIGVNALTVVVTDANGRSATSRMVVRVLPSTSELEVTSANLPPIISSASARYEAYLAAAGGVKPYSWKVLAGALPAGVQLSADGSLTGSVRAGATLGDTKVTFGVTDSVGNAAQAVITVRVVEPGALVIKTLNLPDGLVGSDYLSDLSAQNADSSPTAKPLIWRIAAGSLPEGMTLSTQGDERGILSGKPLVAGNYSFSVQVEDAKGQADTADFLLQVFPLRFKVSLAAAPPPMHPGDTVTLTVAASGVDPKTTHFSLYSGQLPPGLVLSPEGQISGTIGTDNVVGVYNVVIEATDGSGASGLGAFAFEVLQTPKKSGCSASPGEPNALTWLGGLVLAGVLASRRRRVFRLSSPLGWVAGLLVMLAAPVVRAQGYQTVGPTPTPFAYVNGGTLLSNVNRTQGQAVSLPFSFKFYGQSFSSVTVTQFGYLVFVGSDAESSNFGIPTQDADTFEPQTFIAPWWDDLNKVSTSTIRYSVDNDAPDRRVVTFEWRDMVSASSQTGKFSFQVKLYEGTNHIQLAYGPTLPAASSASVGLQQDAADGLDALSCTTPTAGGCTASTFPANQVIDFLLPPDLSVDSVSSDPTGYSGVLFRASAVLHNVGGRDAKGAKVRFYLSTDTVLDASDATVGDTPPKDLAPFDTALVTATGPIPAGTAPGNYYLLAKADPDGAIVEIDEGNNGSTPTPIKVGQPTPDLLVSTITAPTTDTTPGATVQVSRAITNAGNAAASSPFKYTYFLSDNSVATFSDTPLTPVGSVASLAAGASDTQTEAVMLPSTLAPGRYWVGICVDYDPASPESGVQEISEVNNCATAPTGFIVSTGALTVLTTTLPATSQYAPYGLRLEATGGDGTYQWAQTGGQLPAGVTLTIDGDLGGNPSVSGLFNFDVKVTSAGGEATVSLSLQIGKSDLPLTIVDQDLPAAEFARSYVGQLVAVGGKPPYVWSLTGSAHLPVGMALATDGEVEGRATEAGDFPFSVQLTDSGGATTTKDLRLRVLTPSALHIATTGLATAYLQKDYAQVLQAVGGQEPYEWKVMKFVPLAENETDEPAAAEGDLPGYLGIAIQVDGKGQSALQGVPLRAGLYAVTLRVVDQAGVDDYTTLPLQVSYDTGLAITTTALPDAFVGQPYAAKLSRSGADDDPGIAFSIPCVKQVQDNLEDYSCAASDPSQALPAGLALAADGTLSGTPAAPTDATTDSKGQLQPVLRSFLVKVVDGAGREDVRSLSIKVRPAPAAAKGCSGAPVGPSTVALFAAVVAVLRSRRRRI